MVRDLYERLGFQKIDDGRFVLPIADFKTADLPMTMETA